ncbi:hypothetical protein BDB01DRAFT_738901 [Pilobolus umbonatus]|nr:hypothetical protein BDB01DRAFT_738901 [Pilobolus umbonatus]
MILSKEWPQRLEYYISVPKRIFSRGESIPIDFKLIPNPDSDGIRIRSLTISLMEGITFKLNNDTQEESGDSSDEDKYYKTCRIVSYFKDESFSSEDFWEKTEVIVVPFSPEFIQCDTKNAYYKVEHRLKYVISLINHRDAVSELRATMPIYIIPSEDGNELPTYESSTRNTLYIPSPALLEDSTSPFEEDFFPRTPPHPIIDPSYPYTMMNSPTTNRQNNLVCPAGLPSYSTAMLSSSDMSPDELPSYE